MAWRLAILAGYPSADVFLESLQPEEWHELQAMNCVEPLGVRGVEQILARIGELLSAFMGGNLKAADFAPWLPKAEDRGLSVPESREALRTHLSMLVGAK